MLASFCPKNKYVPKDKYKNNLELINDSKILSHCETEVGNDNSSNYSKYINTKSSQNKSKPNFTNNNNNSGNEINNNIVNNSNCCINESLSGIIDLINENNLNLFYEDDSTNFKRNIDYLNIKFYLETEKILASSNFNSNNLFLILFKQINLYIKEIERLNLIILDLKNQQKNKDSETIQVISGIKNIKTEVIIENNRYFSGEKIKKDNKTRIIKNKIFVNEKNNSSNNIISVKRDQALMMKRHRRNNSEQIESNSLLNENINSNNKKENKVKNENNKQYVKGVLRNNTLKNNINKNKNIYKETLNATANDISTIGLLSPKSIKATNYSNKKKFDKKSKIANDNSKIKASKIFKRKNNNICQNKNNKTNQQTELLTNTNCSLTKLRSSVLNKSNTKTKINNENNCIKNVGENIIDKEINELSKFEDTLNELKNYLKIKGSNDTINVEKNNSKEHYVYSTPPYVIRNKIIKPNNNEKAVSFKLFID